VILPELFFPAKLRPQASADPVSAFELDAMALAVVEADGLDDAIALERPGQARGGVLPA